MACGWLIHIHKLSCCLQLLKERASGMYQLSAFYFARVSSDLPMDMAIPSIFVILIYFVGGLRVDGAKYFFENYFTILLVSRLPPRQKPFFASLGDPVLLSAATMTQPAWSLGMCAGYKLMQN